MRSWAVAACVANLTVWTFIVAIANGQDNIPSLRDVRRLNDKTTDCPSGLWHCDNPDEIPVDPTVVCDVATCQWNLTALDPNRPPEFCDAIEILPSQVNNLTDSLEPCLWWDMLYGGRLPPDVAAADSNNETDDFLWNESLIVGSLTINTSLWESVGVNISGILQPPPPPPPAPGNNSSSQIHSESSFSFNQTNPDATAVNNSATVTTVNLETILLTFFFQQPEQRQRWLRRLQSTEIDRVQLNVLTSTFIMNEIRIQVGNEVHVERISLDITSVQDSRLDDDTVTSTEAVDGQLVFAHEIGVVIHSSVIQNIVNDAFTGDALARYVTLLQTKADAGSVLSSTASVSLGLPSDVLNAYNDQNSMSLREASANTQPVFQWNTFWIAIIAGGAAGVLIFACGCIFICRRWYCQRAHEKDDFPNVKPSKSLETKRTASASSTPNSGNKNKTPRLGNTSGYHGGKDGKGCFHHYSNGDNDSDGEDEESKAGRYASSEVTSVYSYIDTNLHDDQSYSVAPSMMYANVAHDDQSMVSRHWSVVDGINDSASLPLSVVATVRRRNNNDDLNTTTGSISMDDDGESAIVPTRMIVTKQRQNNKGASIFADDNDDLSMISDQPKQNISKSSVRDNINILGLDNRKRALDRSSPLTKLDWRLNDYTKEDGSQVSDTGSAVPRQHLPFTSLLHNESKDDIKVSSSSTKNQVKTTINGTELLVNKSGSTAEQSMSTDCDSKRKGIQLSESSDDDSSLFMGPGSLSSKQDGERVIALTAKNKVETNEKDGFRIGPMAMGAHNLTDKEKRHLGLSVRVRKASMKEDEEDENTSIVLPINYNPSEEKKEDLSMTNASSLHSQSGSMSMIASLASF